MGTAILFLIIFGILMMILEFILPGGVIGVLGVLVLITAVVLGFAEYGVGTGAMIATGAFLFAIIITGLWLRFFHTMPIGKKLTLDGSVKGTDVYKPQKELLGKTGKAFTNLRPAGRAEFDGVRWDVSAEVGHIEKGSPIEVVDVQGGKIVVRNLG